MALRRTGLQRFPLQTLKEFPSKNTATIIEPDLPVDLLNFPHILGREFYVRLQVGTDSGRGFGLGKHRMALSNAPGYAHVSNKLLRETPTAPRARNSPRAICAGVRLYFFAISARTGSSSNFAGPPLPA